ncbi:MAG: hypothetical protein ABIL58_20440 [Pseudomonadota bacterium]
MKTASRAVMAFAGMCFMILFVAAPAALWAAEVVTVTGMSFYEEGREAIAREKALDDAKRQAIEQALGTQVSSQTVVENFEVTRDQVMSHAAGYLRDMQILHEGKTDLGSYEVELRARVEIGALVADMDRFRKVLSWQKNPRVAVTLPAGMAPDVVPAARKAAQRLSRELSADGFQVFTATADKTPTLGLLVVLGLELSSSTSEYQGVKLQLHEVSLTAAIERPGTGELLATSSAVKSLPGANRLAVLDKGAAECVTAVWKDLRRQLVRLWEQELYSQRQIDLVVHNVSDHAHAAEMAAVLKSDVSSVVDVQLVNFSGKTAEFGLQYKGWPEHLANELQMAHFKSRYFDMTLKSIAGSRLEMSLNTQAQ